MNEKQIEEWIEDHSQRIKMVGYVNNNFLEWEEEMVPVRNIRELLRVKVIVDAEYICDDCGMPKPVRIGPYCVKCGRIDSA